MNGVAVLTSALTVADSDTSSQYGLVNSYRPSAIWSNSSSWSLVGLQCRVTKFSMMWHKLKRSLLSLYLSGTCKESWPFGWYLRYGMQKLKDLPVSFWYITALNSFLGFRIERQDSMNSTYILCWFAGIHISILMLMRLTYNYGRVLRDVPCKRWESAQKDVENDPCSPDVHLKVVPVSGKETVEVRRQHSETVTHTQ